jgi:1-acyl-sn-glycerol-3-phosphate acyltransferase
VIRTLWTALVTTFATFYWAPVILFQALLGRKDGDWYVAATQSWTRTVLWASGCEVVIHGAEHVRPGIPQVIASNHVSWFDVFAIAGTLHVPFHFVAKKELLRIPLFGPAMQAAGHVIIDRSNRERAIESLREAGERIRHTPAAVVIFPEGTRSRTGRLMPFKKGAFLLAAESGVAIVPAAVTGSFGIMPPGSRRIRPNTIHVHYLEPIPAAEVAAAGTRGVEPLMERVHAAIGAALSEAEPLAAPASRALRPVASRRDDRETDL